MRARDRPGANAARIGKHTRSVSINAGRPARVSWHVPSVHGADEDARRVVVRVLPRAIPVTYGDDRKIARRVLVKLTQQRNAVAANPQRIVVEWAGSERATVTGERNRAETDVAGVVQLQGHPASPGTPPSGFGPASAGQRLMLRETGQSVGGKVPARIPKTGAPPQVNELVSETRETPTSWWVVASKTWVVPPTPPPEVITTRLQAAWMSRRLNCGGAPDGQPVRASS